MDFVLNCLDEEQTVVVGGNHFKFKPLEIKAFFQPNIARLITLDKRDYGFADLPPEFEDLSYRQTEEAKKIFEEKRKEGVEAYCARLRAAVYNAQVSLRMDLEKANIKADPRAFASKGDVVNMEKLIKYQKGHNDESLERIEKLKELEKKLGK
jgi:hypothetical protein